MGNQSYLAFLEMLRDRTLPPPVVLDLLPVLFEICCSLERFRDSRDPMAMHADIKSDGTLVSFADRYSATALLRELRRLFPDDIIICEDDGSVPHVTELPTASSAWIVDPLDNTRGYLASADNYSVLLTRLVHGSADCIIVMHPAKGVITWAQSGLGAFSNGVKLAASGVTDYKQSRRVGVYCNGFTTVSESLSESTEALLAVANGSIDAAIIFMCGHKIWDIAFSALLLPESGGCVSDEMGQNIGLSTLEPRHKWIVASNGWLHQSHLQLLRQNVSIC